MAQETKVTTKIKILKLLIVCILYTEQNDVQQHGESRNILVWNEHNDSVSNMNRAVALSEASECVWKLSNVEKK